MLVVFTCLFMLVPAALMAGGFWLLGGWGLLAGLGIALLVVLAITLVFLRHGIFRKTPRQAGDTLSPGPGEKRTTAGLARQQRLRNKLLAHGRENLWITSYDGLRLYGVFVPGAPGEKRVMMILHCYGGNALQMAEYALYFREHYGFNILLPDMRCHGQSDGRYLGMGWLERKDCLQWLALLEKKLQTSATGGHLSCVDEEKAAAMAQRRFEEAQAKAASTTRWIRLLEERVFEYKGLLQALNHALDTDAVNALARLDRMIESLEAYIALAPPGEPLPSIDEMTSVARTAPGEQMATETQDSSSDDGGDATGVRDGNDAPENSGPPETDSTGQEDVS